MNNPFEGQQTGRASVGTMMGVVVVCIGVAIGLSHAFTYLFNATRKPKQLPLWREYDEDIEHDDPFDGLPYDPDEQYGYDEWPQRGGIEQEFDEGPDTERAPRPRHARPAHRAAKAAGKAARWGGRQAKRGYEGVRRLPWGEYQATAARKAATAAKWAQVGGAKAYDAGSRAYKAVDDYGWSQVEKDRQRRVASFGDGRTTQPMPAVMHPSRKTWASAGQTVIEAPYGTSSRATTLVPNRKKKRKGTRKAKRRSSR